MKKITRYICIAGAALLAAACENNLPSTEGEGTVSFDLNFAAETRAGDDIFVPNDLLIRIYSVSADNEASLIRRYTSMSEIPSPLYLVAGSYKVKVEAGNDKNVAFKDPGVTETLRQSLCYSGEQDFTVAANTSTQIAVECPTYNVSSSVIFDATKGENAQFSDVKIQLAAMTSEATSLDAFASDATASKATILEFDQTGTGFFLLPEEVTTLVWTFSGTHGVDGAIAKVGRIRDVKPGHAYKVNFVYSKTPDGYIGLRVEIDESLLVTEHQYIFKPQPEISSSNIDVTKETVYTGETINLSCESINAIETVKLNGMAIYSDGTVVENALTGVTVTQDSEAVTRSAEVTKIYITLAKEYFSTLAGAYQTLLFDVTDAGGGDCKQEIQFIKQGLVSDATTYDLWANTATFEAVVTESSPSNVVIRYKKQGTDSWIDVPATLKDGMTYTATANPEWAESKNVNNHTIYTPNTQKGIFANATYEYQLVVNNIENESAILTTSTTQSIPYASFEDSSLACFTEEGSKNTANWGSGNNSYTPSLCTQATFAGMTGNKCVKLTAAMGGLSGVFELLAAGNLFTGTFNKPSTTGTVAFGVNYAWNARPTALKMKLHHTIGNVNENYHDGPLADGAADQASIYVAIVDWNSRHETKSGTGAPSGVWSVENGINAVSEGKIIGYGAIYPTGTTTGNSMVEVNIPIKYYDKVTKPSNNYTLVIAAATSRYGDYMNGCDSNVMYVDDFQWVY